MPTPKTIIIDGRMLKWTGIGRYTEQLLKELLPLDAANRYIVLLTPEDAATWKAPAANVEIEIIGYSPYGIKNHTHLPVRLRKLKPDLVHFPHFTAPLFYFGRYIITLHDFTLVHFKNKHHGGLERLLYNLKYWAMRFMTRHAIQVSRAILVPSQTIKQELVDRYRRDLFPISPEKVHVTLEAVDPLAKAAGSLARLKLSGPFLLYVGTAFPHKNLEQLIEAFSRLDDKQLQLVVVGPESYFYQRLRSKVDALGLTERVIMPGYVSEDELAGLYSQAALFVFPSLSEGFGLPPLEAMAYGTPVISSNVSSMPEILGAAAAYFDPLDTGDMANKIEALLQDPAELKRLRTAGPKQVKKYSWKRMAQQTLDVYRKTLGD